MFILISYFFFESLSGTSDLIENLTKITRHLHEDLRTFLTISRSFLLRIRNISDKICRETQNTFFVQKLFFRKYYAVHEIV
jgi:hypothetical protein